MKLENSFWKISKKLSNWLNTPIAAIGAVTVIVVWFFSGFIFQWSDAHSMFINTFTNVVTFLIVFLIENAQNRNAAAVHLKLDELLEIQEAAQKHLVSIEEVPEKDFKHVVKTQRNKRKKTKNNLTRDRLEAVPAGSHKPNT
jgi:low affinity Fe/Cu permease